MWLRKEAQGKAALFWILATVKVNFVYAFVALWVLISVGVIVPASPGVDDFLDIGFVALLLISLKYALFEELLFRFPLAILVWLQYSLGNLLVFALMFSILFGLAHGSPENILIQGVFGFMLSLLFLKCGGLQGRPFKALACTFAAHWLYNASVFLIGMFF